MQMEGVACILAGMPVVMQAEMLEEMLVEMQTGMAEQAKGTDRRDSRLWLGK